ncbi:MAG: hypothetical protein ACI85K_003425 [Hyphomicrobiaceae bacterium]
MFLPRISLLMWILALALAGCGGSSASKAPQLHVAEVVAGAGDISPEAVELVRQIVATELVQLQEVFGGKKIERFFVHVHASREDMPAPLVAGVHEDAPGFAVLGRHQIHLIWGQMGRTGSRPRGVVRHELVHELLDQYAGKHGNRMPRWFHEGLAQLLAGDTYLNAREDDLVWRVGAGSLPRLDTLAKHFPTQTTNLRTAYALSYSYVAWLSREYGMSLLLRVARYTDDMTSFGQALVGQTGKDSLQLETAWQNYVLYGSGAPWRVLFSSWFSLLMILVLPVLVLALIRRLSAEQRAARHLAARARSDKARALEAAARQEQLLRLAAENDFEEREDLGRLEQDGEQR